MPLAATDPALDRLLFAIALLKAVAAAVACVAVAWRLRDPIAPRRAAIYVSGALAMLVATALLFTRTAMWFVPLGFDGGGAMVVLSMLTDARLLARLTHRYPAFRGVRVRTTRRRKRVANLGATSVRSSR